MTMRCQIRVSSSSRHISHLLTGFGILEANGEVQTEIIKDKKYAAGQYQSALISVQLESGKRLVFDCTDSSDISPETVEESDLYFKRSFDSRRSYSSKVRPLGFYFPVYSDHPYRLKRFIWSFLNDRSKFRRDSLIQLVRSFSVLGWLARDVQGARGCALEDYEHGPEATGEGARILFLSKVWDPFKSNLSIEKREERLSINQMRSECIRKLRKEFGSSFIGGLEANKLAMESFSDCVVENTELTRKDRYLRLMQSSDICISTVGLQDSNPAKLAEYIAASRAIVTEPLRHQVPGDFSPPHNCLFFRNADECVHQVRELFNDTEKRKEMMRRNHAYYRNYLRPDVLVMNALREGLKLSQ